MWGKRHVGVKTQLSAVGWRAGQAMQTVMEEASQGAYAAQRINQRGMTGIRLRCSCLLLISSCYCISAFF